MVRFLALLIIVLLLLPFAYLAGYGLLHDRDVVNGITTALRAVFRDDLVQTVPVVQPEELLPAETRDVVWRGELQNEELGEASGLAASRQQEGIFFSINDGGNEPRIFALGDRGEDRGSWAVNYDDQHDFEDLAAFSFEGENYLLLADTGDNLNWRRQLTIVVIKEPLVGSIDSIDQGAVVSPAWSFRYSYPDGYRDCEGVAVDEENGLVQLLSKRRVPAEVFTVPVRPDAKQVVASLIARLENLPQPTARDLREDPWYGKYRSTPTALDIVGRKAVIVTYRDAYLYTRKRPATWAEAFAEIPERIALPDISGLESGALSLDGKRLTLVGEREDGVGRMGVYEVQL